MKLCVVLLAVVAGNGYAIGQMVAKGVDRVVHDDGLSKGPSESAQVFDVHAVVGLHAVLAVQAVRKELVLRVEQFYTSVSIGFL